LLLKTLGQFWPKEKTVALGKGVQFSAIVSLSNRHPKAGLAGDGWEKEKAEMKNGRAKRRTRTFIDNREAD
jgi:hypothetical protein